MEDRSGQNVAVVSRAHLRDSRPSMPTAHSDWVSIDPRYRTKCLFLKWSSLVAFHDDSNHTGRYRCFGLIVHQSRLVSFHASTPSDAALRSPLQIHRDNLRQPQGSAASTGGSIYSRSPAALLVAILDVAEVKRVLGRCLFLPCTGRPQEASCKGPETVDIIRLPSQVSPSFFTSPTRTRYLFIDRIP